MVGYKENFVNAIDFAVHKTKYSFWKLILLGIMGSFYVGLGYIAFIYIISKNQDWEAIEQGASIVISGGTLVLASALFPVGLLLIIFLGGSLFTSDNLTSIAILTKKAKIRPVVIKWCLTLFGNIVGAFIIAAICRGGHIFSDRDLQVLSEIISSKVNKEWWNVFFSGILCNILVAGTVWATLATKHSIAKIFLIYFPIWLFAIVGFQHVVANVILFAFGWVHPDNPFIANIGDLSLNEWTFNAIFINLLPAMVGNWLSGSIFLPFIYFWLSEHHKKIKMYKLNGCKVVEDKCLTHEYGDDCYFDKNKDVNIHDDENEQNKLSKEEEELARDIFENSEEKTASTLVHSSEFDVKEDSKLKNNNYYDLLKEENNKDNNK
ncbi:MAG: formate/nitrite transporter family protein [Metamycoplasmataceae bacterium]